MTDVIATPGQTVGPFFHYALPFADDSRLAPAGYDHAIRLHGNVFDGAGDPVPDALVEVWQPDSTGTVVQVPGSLGRDGWTFTGWGRSATDATGHYGFTTVEPGSAIPGRAPFFALAVVARGLLDVLFTRAYLPQGRLADDPLLSALTDADRHTLVCRSEPQGYRFDIHLQGDCETVFLTFVDDDR